MKKLIYPIACLALVAVSSCNMAGNDDYENLSNDMCACVNDASAGVSDEMKNTIVNAEKNGQDIQTAIGEMAAKNPEKAMADGTKMMEIGPKIEKCAKDLEVKYKDIYTTDNEKQVQEKLLETFKGNKGCEFTYALMKLGLSAK